MNVRTLRTEAREENLEATLEKIGGEELIKRKYPELYKAVMNTRQKLRTPCSCRSDENDEYIFGTRDSCKIRMLNYTPETTLSTVSGIDTDVPKPSLAIIGDIEDMDIGKSIDGFAVSANNVDSLKASSVTNSSVLTSGSSGKFIAKSSFIIIDKDKNGSSFVKTLDSVMESQKIINNEYIVKELDVCAPMPIKHLGASCTTIYYNRRGNNSDYEYSNVKCNNDDIYVYMPFSGSVEFNGMYAPDPDNPVIKDGDKGLILQIENVRNGSSNFDLNYWNDIQWNVTGSVLTWEFPDNWHNVLKKNRLTCANDLNFYCKMYINTTIGVAVPIVIQSNGEEHQDPSYKKIPFINILWGCFAKDVLIRMADGSSKPIDQIVAEDTVMTKDGTGCAVLEVITGNEDQLVYIETSLKNRIRVSKDHPMLTVEGMVKADQLTAGTHLVTADGVESIESLYLVKYFDKAYNLRLEREAVLIADNFYAGDFSCQNRICKYTPPLPAKLEAVQEELADFIDSINKSKKNHL